MAAPVRLTAGGSKESSRASPGFTASQLTNSSPLLPYSRKVVFRKQLRLPSRGHESVETPAMAEYGLDCVVSEIVPGEKRRLPAFQPLPGGSAVGPRAGQCRAAVSALFYADDDALRVGHAAI